MRHVLMPPQRIYEGYFAPVMAHHTAPQDITNGRKVTADLNLHFNFNRNNVRRINTFARKNLPGRSSSCSATFACPSPSIYAAFKLYVAQH